jgi:hypothetical protein
MKSDIKIICWFTKPDEYDPLQIMNFAMEAQMPNRYVGIANVDMYGLVPAIYESNNPALPDDLSSALKEVLP